jgi:hypothetical protein
MGWLIIYLICLFTTILFFVTFHLFEEYLKEDHPIMIWWRKHIVGRQDDILK